MVRVPLCRCAPLGDAAGLGAPRVETDDIAEFPVDTWVRERFMRAVWVCEHRHAWHTDLRVVARRAVAHPPPCTN